MAYSEDSAVQCLADVLRLLREGWPRTVSNSLLEVESPSRNTEHDYFLRCRPPREFLLISRSEVKCCLASREALTPEPNLQRCAQPVGVHKQQVYFAGGFAFS